MGMKDEFDEPTDNIKEKKFYGAIMNLSTGSKKIILNIYGAL